MMIPYGIYDPEANHGFVVVGTQRETPAFAVDAILLWWNKCGSRMYWREDGMPKCEVILERAPSVSAALSNGFKMDIDCLVRQHIAQATLFMHLLICS